MAIQTYQDAITREPNFPEAYNNLGNALREANRPDEAIACYTMCIQLQFARPHNAALARALQANPQGAAMQQAQRLSVAYNNLGGLLKMQVGKLPHTPTPFHPISPPPGSWSSASATLRHVNEGQDVAAGGRRQQL